MLQPQDIIQFWFSTPMNQHWFSATSDIDQKIRENFQTHWQEARKGRHDGWKKNAEGCLALIILLDQFPLNMFRGNSESFVSEKQAVAICKHAIKHGFDEQLSKQELSFLYMPLMHSESMSDQNLAVEKYTKAGLESNLRFAKHHRNLIERFGRFPHRNNILGRESRAEELSYLSSKEAFLG